MNGSDLRIFLYVHYTQLTYVILLYLLNQIRRVVTDKRDSVTKFDIDMIALVLGPYSEMRIYTFLTPRLISRYLHHLHYLVTRGAAARKMLQYILIIYNV